MISVTVCHRFEYAHRLPNHTGKCSNLHGHSGKVEVTAIAQAGPLTEPGMVLDFGHLKTIVRRIIDVRLDHSTILNTNDPLYEFLKGWGNLQLKLVKFWGEPTAENLAIEIHKLISEDVLLKGFTLIVKFWEGPNSCATFAPASPNDRC